MNKKTAIKKLKEAHENYSMQVDASTTGTNTSTGAKALIQILNKKEDGTSIVTRYVSAYGVGKDLNEAQDNAIVNAVQALGL